MRHIRTVATLFGLPLVAGITILAVPMTRASTESPATVGADTRSAPEAADARNSGQLVVDWNRELLAIEQTPGGQPRRCIRPRVLQFCRPRSTTRSCRRRTAAHRMPSR